MKQHLMTMLCLLALSGPAHACIWDRDTLAMERARFPEVNELIVGYFPRHSPAYYEWRKQQVLSIHMQDRTPASYDDLGASYDKLGEHDKAIETMLAKFERYPDQGVYETHANLGTFYIHNGELEKGAQYIGSAIEINPDAHFGREVYQKLLVEYVIEQRATGNRLPLERYPRRAAFAEFVTRNMPIDEDPFGSDSTADDDRDAEVKRAIKGVLGMMRFGNYDSPVLLEVLGDLLQTQSEDHHGLQRLAARAYLKASYEVEDPEVANQYREKAKSALRMQEGVDLASIEKALKKEIAKGDSYFVQIEADEKAWIEAGDDVDAKFIEKYYDAEPALTQSVLSKGADRLSSFSIQDKLLIVVIGGILVLVIFAIARPLLRAKRKA
ncbi:MAG: hypothetical protein AAF085_00020 [Planctomycetota bacterium]